MRARLIKRPELDPRDEIAALQLPRLKATPAIL
jgi:hypothetical protein